MLTRRLNPNRGDRCTARCCPSAATLALRTGASACGSLTADRVTKLQCVSESPARPTGKSNAAVRYIVTIESITSDAGAGETAVVGKVLCPSGFVIAASADGTGSSVTCCLRVEPAGSLPDFVARRGVRAMAMAIEQLPPTAATLARCQPPLTPEQARANLLVGKALALRPMPRAQQAAEAADLMRQNVRDATERGEKLAELADRSEELKDESREFKSNTRALNDRMRARASAPCIVQ